MALLILEKDNFSQSATALEEVFKKACQEKEEIEKKLSKSKLLSKKVFKLKTSANFLTERAQNRLKSEIHLHMGFIGISEKLTSQIRMYEDDMKKLQERIKQVKSSKNLLTPEKIADIRKDIERKQEAIEKGISVQKEISLLEKNGNFLVESEIEQLERKLEKLELVFKGIRSASAQADSSFQEGWRFQVCVNFKCQLTILGLKKE